MSLLPAYVLRCALWLPLSRAETFAFFADAGNLPRITPPWLGFKILTPQPVVIAPGALIDYTVRVLRLPVHWQTRITAYEPPARFVDTQLRGPYTLWHHLHTFEESAGGTLIADEVHYRPPLGVLGRALHAAMIRRQLTAIFSYRQQTIPALLLGEDAPAAKVVSPVHITWKRP